MDMIEKAKDSARENLQTIKHKVCKLAQTLFFALCHQQTMREHQGACIWIRKSRNQPTQCLDEAFTSSLVSYYWQCRIWISYSETFQESWVTKTWRWANCHIKATRGILAQEWFQAGTWFFKETVAFKLSHFRAQQNYVVLCTLLFC